MNDLLSFALAAVLLLAGCTGEPDDVYDAGPDEPAVAAHAEFTSYGEAPAMGDDLVALTPASLTADPSAYDGTVVRVEGTIAQVCRNKGCWLTLDNPTATPVRVEVPRDAEGGYAFTFPTDLPISEAVIEGTVSVDTTSVETLRHLAQDEGRPQAEIDAITAPEPTVVVTARGALVRTPDASPAVQS